MAYTTATLIAKSPYLTDGRVTIEVAFSGDAGEPVVTQGYSVSPSDTGQTLRAWAAKMAANLNSVKTVASALTVGQSISIVPITPPADPATVAKEIWLGKLKRYQYFIATGGFTGALGSDLAAIKADIEATYVAGYLT